MGIGGSPFAGGGCGFAAAGLGGDTSSSGIDGNGNSESAPHAEYFYADGTVSSNPGFSLSEVFITCPTEVTACQAENAVCEGELAAATDPLRGADAEWPTGARAF